MKKIITIDGMSCGHCQAAVEKSLNELEGVTAKVNLKKKQAVVVLTAEVSDEALKSAVREAGFDALTVAEKKRVF